MSDIRIKNVAMQNFLSVRSANINFTNRGLVGVLGSNGEGKSTCIVESLCCGLFGISERYGKSRNEWVNRFVGKDLVLKVDLDVDNVPVSIHTYRKHFKYKDEVFLMIDGKDCRGNTNEQTYDRIIKLLDMDYTGFTSGIIFGQALSQYFSALNDSAQKQIMERLLGIMWISNAYELAKNDTKDCLNSLTKHENTVESLTKLLTEHLVTLEQYQKKSEEFEANKNKKIKELKDQFRNTKDISETESRVKECEAALDDIDSIYSELTLKLNSLASKIAANTASSSVQKVEIDKIDAKINKVDKHELGTICLHCGQKITAKSVAEYKKHLEKDKEEPQDKYAELLNIGSELAKQYDEVKKEKNELDGQKREIQSAFNDSKKVYDSIRIENARAEEFNKALTKQLDDLAESENVWLNMISEIEAAINQKEAALKIADDKCSELKVEVDYHKFWEEGFSNRGLKSLIMESCIPQMNADGRLYSRTLGGKYDIEFSAQTQLKGGDVREKFNVAVQNKKGALNYDGNSNGERRAIDSIVMFVLGDLAARRSNKRFTLLILDDVFEKLDMEICDSISNILKMMTVPKPDRISDYKDLPERESVFLLTHLDYFYDKFENRILVYQDLEGTKIKEESNI